MERWRGRVAVVTGASAGIGADIAFTLAEKGLIVAGLARRKERIDELAAKSKGKLVGIKCSVGDEEQIKEAFQWIEKNIGPVAVLVNNAGIARHVAFDANSGSTTSWKEILDTNVLGLSLCTRYALESMRKNKITDGHFININSVAGHIMPVKEFVSGSMYLASKHAVTVLTDGLRKEVANLNTKIRVSSLSPGYVKTEILDVSGEGGEDMRKMMAVAPALEPKNITSGIIYILSSPACVNISELTIQPTGEIW